MRLSVLTFPVLYFILCFSYFALINRLSSNNLALSSPASSIARSVNTCLILAMLFLTFRILCGARIAVRVRLAKCRSVKSMSRSRANTYHNSCKSPKDFFRKSFANHSRPIGVFASRFASTKASKPCPSNPCGARAFASFACITVDDVCTSMRCGTVDVDVNTFDVDAADEDTRWATATHTRLKTCDDDMTTTTDTRTDGWTTACVCSCARAFVRVYVSFGRDAYVNARRQVTGYVHDSKTYSLLRALSYVRIYCVSIYVGGARAMNTQPY